MRLFIEFSVPCKHRARKEWIWAWQKLLKIIFLNSERNTCNVLVHMNMTEYHLVYPTNEKNMYIENFFQNKRYNFLRKNIFLNLKKRRLLLQPKNRLNLNVHYWTTYRHLFLVSMKGFLQEKRS